MPEKVNQIAVYKSDFVLDIFVVIHKKVAQKNNIEICFLLQTLFCKSLFLNEFFCASQMGILLKPA
jgi:hypothetical protein